MSAPAATPGFSLSGLFGLDSLRQRLNLPNPGGWEGLHREAKTVHTTNFLFDGAKFDLTSILTPNFQVLHSLSWGSQSYPPSYQFGSVFADGVTMLHGQVDHDGGLQARAHYNWAAARAKAAAPAQSAASLADPTADPNAPHPALLDAKNNSTTKLTAHVTTSGGQSMLQVEHDHHGADYTLNAKAVNPNPIDASPSWSTSKAPAATGIYQVAYLQSISRSVAVGGEFVYQRPTPDLEEPSLTLALRYAPPPSPLPNPTTIPTGMQSPFPPVNPRDPTQVFTTTFAPASGLLHTTYWRRLNQRLEVCAELQALISKGGRMGDGRREGIATVGFKLDTIAATIRGQVDSQGRLSATVEERIAPGIALQLAGEIDYGKGGGGQGRVGAGFTLEM